MVQRPPPQPSGSGPPDSGSRRSSPSHRLSLRLVQNAGIALPSPHGKWRRLLPRAQPPPGTCHKVGVGGRSAPERQQGELLPVVRGIVLVSGGGHKTPCLLDCLSGPPIFLFTHRMCKDPGAGRSNQGLPPSFLQLCGLGAPLSGCQVSLLLGCTTPDLGPPYSSQLMLLARWTGAASPPGSGPLPHLLPRSPLGCLF